MKGEEGRGERKGKEEARRLPVAPGGDTRTRLIVLTLK